MIYLPSIYTVIDQQKNYYCAASCVKSTLNYINGSSESLSAIYANLQGTGQIQPGVALSRIAPYLNEEQNETVYVTRDYTISYENANGKMVKEYDCSDSKSFFFSDWVANIEVYGDYIMISSINDVSLYKMTGETIKLVAFANGSSGNIDSFYGAANLNVTIN